MYWNTPGLQIVVPGSPADARGLMKTVALRSENPTIFIDHQRMQGVTGMVDDDGPGEIPLGVAEVKREGSDVTIVAASVMVARALEAAEKLAADGISAEVVDPRTLVPLDKGTILKSVAKTGRVVVTDESQLSCGVASELAAIIAEEGFESLKAPVKRVCALQVPIPYSPELEDYVFPDRHRIIAGVREVLAAG